MFRRKKEVQVSQDISLLSDLSRLLNGEIDSLEETSEEAMLINQIIDAQNSKNNKIVKNYAELVQAVTKMDRVKEMVDDIKKNTDTLGIISANSDEMAKAIDDVSIYVQKSMETCHDVVDTSSKSIGTIQESFDIIDKAFSDMNNVSTQMSTVSENTKDIDEMTDIINSVAEQTNLLALNASIEAARAGEAGKGFAVVADEIKKLAESTKESAGTIRDKITKLRNDIDDSSSMIVNVTSNFDEGKSKMNEAQVSVAKIESGLSGIDGMFQSIASTVEEQTAATQEVASGIHEMNESLLVFKDICLALGDNVCQFSEQLNDSRLMVQGTCSIENQVMIDVAIADHLMWRWRVYNMLLGYCTFESEKVKDPTKCNLGKWLNNHEAMSEIDSAMQKAIHEPHHQLHAVAVKAIDAFNSGDTKTAESALAEMDLISSNVVKILGNMKG